MFQIIGEITLVSFELRFYENKILPNCISNHHTDLEIDCTIITYLNQLIRKKTKNRYV